MENKVAIVGFKQTKHTGKSELTRERMIYELAKSLYSDLGITREDVDTFIMASNDFHDGRTISNVHTVARVGAYMKDETKVEADGANACLYGVMRILSGNYDTALLTGYSLGGSEFRTQLAQFYSLDPVYTRQRNVLNELSAAAFQARAYMMKYGATEEDLAKTAVKSLKNGAKNPNALRQKADASPDDVLASDPLFSPLHKLHCYPDTDGGCVILLASEKRAKELTDKPVWITGIGQSVENYYFGERELSSSRSTADAAKRAYSMAGISDPKKEIDVAEISAIFAPQEWIISEALGLAEPGGGPKATASGETDLGGAIPVNPSGGALCAHPICGTGLVRIAEATSQLRGEAGDMQVDGAKTAVVHGQDGICAQSNTVLVLNA